MTICKTACIAALSLLFAGCSQVPCADDECISFAVARKIGKEVYWHQDCDTNDEIASAIACWLENELVVDTAVQIGLLNNPDIQAVFEDLGIARADLIDAGLLSNPVFDAVFRVPDQSGLYLNTEFAITQAFLDVLLIPLRIKVACAAFEKAKFHVTQTILDLAFDIEEAFYMLVAEQKRYHLRIPQFDAADAALELATAQQREGNISDLELLDHQRHFLEAKIALAESEVELIRLRSHLNQLMGLCPSENCWKVNDTLPEIPIDEMLDDCLYDIALSQRPDLEEIRWELERIARFGATKQWWAYTDVRGGVGGEKDADGLWTRGPAIAGAVPIFNYGQGERARLCALYRQNVDLLRALEIEVLSEVQAARDECLRYRSLVIAFQSELLPLQERIVTISQYYYNYMTLGIYKLLHEKFQEHEMQIRMTMTLKNYWLATVRLHRALGGNLRPRKGAGE